MGFFLQVHTEGNVPNLLDWGQPNELFVLDIHSSLNKSGWFGRICNERCERWGKTKQNERAVKMWIHHIVTAVFNNKISNKILITWWRLSKEQTGSASCSNDTHNFSLPEVSLSERGSRKIKRYNVSATKQESQFKCQDWVKKTLKTNSSKLSWADEMKESWWMNLQLDHCWKQEST